MNRREQYVVAIDQGTTSTKAVVIDRAGRVRGRSRGDFAIPGIHPAPGWVELSPARMWETVQGAARSAVADAAVDVADIAAIALANQGETVIAFDARDDKDSDGGSCGAPIGNAISWQDRRTEDIVARWRARGLDSEVRALTGLRIESYFSAAKLAWMLENSPNARAAAERGALRWGTSDAWLVWQLSGGRAFVTDAATASRTMLYDLRTRAWSPALMEALGVPAGTLPEVMPNAGELAVARADLLGRAIPITGLCVDQHAALFGHGCRRRHQAKATYGTGCFVLANAGADPAVRGDGLLTALGWLIDGEARYVLEGGVYSAGSIVEWLIRLGLLLTAADADAVATSVDDSRGVVMIPALSGLAAPYWAGDARASWRGMDAGTERGHLVRSALESIGYRVRDICAAMAAAGVSIERLRVDGGLTRSAFLMQHQADALGCPVAVARNPDVTALGVGLMALVGAGLCEPDALPDVTGLDTAGDGDGDGRGAGVAYPPRLEATAAVDAAYQRWRAVCERVAASGSECP